jgi:hypothetical protein
MSDRVLVLDACQVWDHAKGCFYVGLVELKQKYLGLPVYKDRTGRKIAIREGRPA